MQPETTQHDSTDRSRRTARTIARYAGYALVLLFFALLANFSGFAITYGPLFQSIAPSELVLWLGVGTFLFPACCLLGYGIGDELRRPLARAWQAAENMTDRAFRFALGGVYVAAVVLFTLGNRYVLLGFPITDDEYATRFGGQILASGHATVRMFEPSAVFPTLFLLVSHGTVTAMDWLGGQLAWAASEVTHTGNLVFALFAALPFVCVPAVVARRYGHGWALIAMLLLFCSPMALLLSITTHGHVLSRGLLSAGLLLFVIAEDNRSARTAFCCGFVVGAAFVCRPFETSFLAAPFAAVTLAGALRGEDGVRRMVLAFAAGAAMPLVVLAAHAWLVTGNPLVPPRLSPERNVNRFAGGGPFRRLGANLAYNLLLLTVWFAGPIGVLLAAAGAMRDRLTRMLAASFVSVLLLALFHDNIGIHSVGPIHYSETVVPLTVLATAGAIVLRDAMRQRGVGFHRVAAAIALFLVIGLGSFAGVESIALRRQAEIQYQLYGLLESAVAAPEKAVVLADDFRSIWQSVELFNVTGSWVLEWRRPRPLVDDRVLVLLYRPGTEAALRERFPDRRFFRLETATDYEHPRLTPLP